MESFMRSVTRQPASLCVRLLHTLLVAVVALPQATEAQVLSGMVGLGWEPGHDGSPDYTVRVSLSSPEFDSMSELLCSAVTAGGGSRTSPARPTARPRSSASFRAH